MNFFEGGGGVDIYVPKFVSHIHNCYQTDQYKTGFQTNRLIGYIVTLIHSDKLLWENVMNYATMKYLFEGGGVLLVFDIYIQGVSKKMIHFSIGNIFVSPEDIAKPNI